MPLDIAAVVQAAIAPIFLLVAIGSFLTVMTQRLGRVVDRARDLELGLEKDEQSARRARHIEELRLLSKRINCAGRATTLCTFSALMISLVVALIFIGEVAAIPVRAAVSGLFILSMATLIAGLGFFLEEIRVSTKALRIRCDVLNEADKQD